MWLYTYNQAFIVYMPSGVYCEDDYYTHIIIYSEPSLWGSCCSSRQITCFRVLIQCCAVGNDFGIKMMFGSSLAQLVFFSERGLIHDLYMLFVYIYAYWCPTRFQYHMMFASFSRKTDYDFWLTFRYLKISLSLSLFAFMSLGGFDQENNIVVKIFYFDIDIDP